jgi:hypothetical protein
MASLRKKPQGVESPDKPPVMTAPAEAAKLPPVAETEATPIEIEQPDPVAAAEKQALKQRLAEVERAEALTRAAVSQPPPRAAEPQQQVDPLEQAIAALPERVQGWYRTNPQFLTDPEKAAQIQYCHHVARREVGEEGTPRYFDRMESMLGIAPNGNGQARPGQIDKPLPPPSRIEAPPVRQQRYSGPPLSAPPTREAPSMRTGYPVSRREPLTDAEREIARGSGISEEEYQRQKEKMKRMQAAGELQEGRQ